MARPVYFTYSLITADDDIVAASQTPLAGGNLTLITATGVALDAPRRVILTFAGNETGHTFVVYGNQKPDNTGNAIQETVLGTTAGIVATTLDFGFVSRVTIDTAATGAIKVGTNGVGSYYPQMVNYHAQPVELTIGVVVTGTVNYDVEYTYDDIQNTPNYNVTPAYIPPAPTWFDDPILAGESANGDTTFNDPIYAWRVVINSGTGSIAVKEIQAGIRG